MMDQTADQDFRRRLARLKGHWRWILAGTALCGLASLTVSLFLPKIYRATTNLLVSESRIGPGIELPAWQYATLPTYEPYVDNDAMVQSAIIQFHLDQAPYNLDVDSFRRKNILDVQALKSTRLVEIRIEFPDAGLAARLANFFAQGAVEFNDKLNVSDTANSRSFLAQQLQEAESNFTAADLRRTEVRARSRIEDQEKELSILLAEKEQLSAQSQTLKLRLAQDDSKAKYLQSALSREPDKFRLTKSLLSDRFAEKVAERAGQSGILPEAISEETLNTTKEDIRHDFVDSMAEAAAERSGVVAAATDLKTVNGEIARLLVNLARTRGELEKADSDYKLAHEGVEVAARNYQNASVNASSKSQDIKQLAPASVPARPVRPRLILNTLLGTLMGFALLACVAAARESYRDLCLNTWDELKDEPRLGVSR